MSAIDWLSQSVAPPALAPKPTNEAPVTQGAASPNVTVTPLGDMSDKLVGVLPADVTGLPRNMWAFSDPATLVALTQAESMPTLPALQELLTILMLAEVDTPIGDPHGALFLARVDKLLDMGAIEQAQTLLEQAGPDSPNLFRRWFDVALLTGSEDAACDLMQQRPSIAPTYPARIFCLARAGEWTVAALTLNTHRVLGDVTDEEEQLISRFLDPDLYEDEAALPPPDRISPLVFRMREAIGEGLTTQALPLAFAHADLRPTTGWKARLEAAERLARAGVLDPNVLQDLYTSRTPSASGGVWERVKAFQRFDAAILGRDADRIASTLAPAWDAVGEIRAEVAFAKLYARDLAKLAPTPLVTKILLLSPDYADVTGDQSFDLRIAQNDLTDLVARSPQQAAVLGAFTTPQAPDAITRMIDDGKIGEALLRAISLFNAGLNGDPQSVKDALAVFLTTDQDDIARRAALQYLLLERAL